MILNPRATAEPGRSAPATRKQAAGKRRVADPGWLFFAWLLCGCQPALPLVKGEPPISVAPHRPWRPPVEKAGDKPRPPRAVPVELDSRREAFALEDVLYIALQNHPATRVAWENARAAAAALGAKKSADYPSLTLDLGFTEAYHNVAAQGMPAGAHGQFGPSLTLSYLLLDLGGRSAGVDNARELLVASNWLHNAVLQQTVLQTQLAFYQYLAARALHESERVSLAEAEAGLEAVLARGEAGVATLADQLQAQTYLSKTRLALLQFAGQVQISHGALASSMGLPPDEPFEIRPLPQDVSIQGTTAKVEDLMQQALASRPDLKAAAARARAAQARLREARAAGLPSLSVAGTLGSVFLDDLDTHAATASAMVMLRIPLFTGFGQAYQKLQAEAEERAAFALVEGVSGQIEQQVFTAYFSLQTAAERARTAAELLGHASQSAEVALGRYQAGVGSILELLSAQAALADARANQIQTRLQWYASMAQLTHDTGLLELPHPADPARSRAPARADTPADRADPADKDKP